MRRSTERWLVVGLLFVTAAYAVAEDLTVTTYYPSPRGVYQELRIITPPTATAIDISATSSLDGDVRRILFRDPSPGPGPMSIEYLNSTIAPVLSFVGPADTDPNAQNAIVAFMPGADTGAAGVPTLSVGIGTRTPSAGLDIQAARSQDSLMIASNTPDNDDDDVAIRIRPRNSDTGHISKIVFEDPTIGVGSMSIEFWDRNTGGLPIQQSPVIAFMGPTETPFLGPAGGGGQAGTVAFLAPADNPAIFGVPSITVGVGTDTPQRTSPDGVDSGNLDANDVYLRASGRWTSQGPTITFYSYGPGFCGGSNCYSSWPDQPIGVHDVCMVTRVLAGGSDVEWFDEGLIRDPVTNDWSIRIREADRGALVEATCLDW